MYLTLAFLFGILFPVSAIARGIVLKTDPYRVVITGIIYSAVGQLIVIAISGLIGQPVGEQMQAGIEAASKALAANNEIMQSMGMDKLSQAERALSLQKAYSSVIQMFPSSFIIWGAIISYLEYIILYRGLRKKDQSLLKMTPVREFSMRRQAFLYWFGIYLLSYLLTLTDFSAGQMVYVQNGVCISGYQLYILFCLYEKMAESSCDYCGNTAYDTEFRGHGSLPAGLL